MPEKEKTRGENRSAPARYSAQPLWWKRLLSQAEKDSRTVLRDARCLDPLFCDAFFDLCDGKSLEVPEEALDFAQTAVELARKKEDPHLIHRSRGLVVHAHIAREEWDEAALVLREAEAAATGCCAPCRAEYFKRRADYLVERHWADQAAEDLARSIEELGPELKEDGMGRIRFLRGIAYHFKKDRDRALQDAGEALLEFSLESPRGYFLDALAFVACFLQGSQERRQTELALGYLLRFKERIKGFRGKDWGRVRTRLAWVEGGVYAKLGDRRRASDRLESVRQALLEGGPAKHGAAVSLDLAQLLARQLHENNIRAMKRIVATCLRELRLEKALRRRIKKLAVVLDEKPEKAAPAIARTRSRILVPVPGLIYE